MSETEIWDADVRTPGDLKKVEDELYADAMAKALKVFEQKLQRMADALGATGSDGRRLRRTRRIGMEVTSTFGTARISVLCGQCKTTGGWETPFRDRIFRGRRGALSPSLEWKVATTVCETGAFEKAAKVCGTWGCALTRLSTFETKASVLRGLLSAFLNYQIKVFTTPLRMPFAPLPS